MKRQTLDEVRDSLRALDVHETCIESVTQVQLDAIYADTPRPAYCHKCGSEHTVGSKWAAEVKLPVNAEGIVLVKCGRCYL